MSLLFEQRFWEPIRRGEVTATIRRWKRRQVVAGHRYRTAAGILEVDAVSTVAPAAIDDALARRCGYSDAAALVADLRGDDDLPLTHVEFHFVDEADPRDELAADAELTAADVDAITARLDRLDRASSHGSWTTATLRAIATNPGVRAGDLATTLGRERAPFKLDVRKLKHLGLTHSLTVGYRLSPRGEAYLRARDH